MDLLRAHPHYAAVSAPVHTDVVPSLPSPQISTPVPTTVTLPASRSVPSSVWQHNRRAVDYDAVSPPSTPAVGPPSPNGDKPLNIRAATHSVGAVTTVTLPLPTATAPIPHPHVHRADGGAGCDHDAEADSDDEKRDLHARMLLLPIKGLGRPHAAATLNSIEARQLFVPTALFNAAPVPKATAA